MASRLNRPFMSKRGLIDFIVQRLSAIVIAIYVVHLVIVFSINDGMNYVAWRSYFGSGYALILSTLTVLAVVVHAWVGMWTIGTDYLRERAVGAAANVIRIAFQTVVAAALVAFLFWNLALIWGWL